MFRLQLPNLREMFTTDLAQVDWKRTGLLVFAILAAAAALWQFAMPRVRTITEREFRKVPEIHRTETVKRVFVACPQQGIQVLDKAELAKKLDLDWLQGGNIAAALAAGENLQKVNSPSPEGTKGLNPEPRALSPEPDLQITATADLPESDNGYEEVSVINLQTGESQIQAREKDSPWFQLRNDAAIGVKYGVGQNLTYTGTAYGRWDFLRIKDVYISTNGDLSTDGAARIQFGAEYRI